jgi:hypothetical protein
MMQERELFKRHLANPSILGLYCLIICYYYYLGCTVEFAVFVNEILTIHTFVNQSEKQGKNVMIYYFWQMPFIFHRQIIIY